MKRFNKLLLCAALSTAIGLEPVALFADTTTDTTLSTSMETGGTGTGSAGTSGSVETTGGPVYHCVLGDCCDCSYMLQGLVDEIIARDRFNETRAGYSSGEFGDDLRMGLFNQMNRGSDYDIELAKYEMALLLDRYLDTSLGAGKQIHMMQNTGTDEAPNWQPVTVPWTKKAAIQACWNAYEYKYSQTDNRSTSLSEFANSWENNVKPYIVFRTTDGSIPTKITPKDIKEMFEGLGISSLDSVTALDNPSASAAQVYANLHNVSEHLGHKHIADSALTGENEACYCHHACSEWFREQFLWADHENKNVHKVSDAPTSEQSIIKSEIRHNGYDYDYYIEAKVPNAPTDALDGVMADKIRIGVVKEGNYYRLAECVCRLGIQPVINDIRITPSWDPNTNYAQPEGLTNVAVKLELPIDMINSKININLEDLINDQLPGATAGMKKIMLYELKDSLGNSKVTAQISKDGTVIPKTQDGQQNYSINIISDNTVQIAFRQQDLTKPVDATNPAGYVLEGGKEYSIKIYIHSPINPDIKYSKARNENASVNGKTYMTARLGTTKPAKITYLGNVEIVPASGTDKGTYSTDITTNVANIDIKYAQIAHIN